VKPLVALEAALAFRPSDGARRPRNVLGIEQAGIDQLHPALCNIHLLLLPFVTPRAQPDGPSVNVRPGHFGTTRWSRQCLYTVTDRARRRNPDLGGDLGGDITGCKPSSSGTVTEPSDAELGRRSRNGQIAAERFTFKSRLDGTGVACTWR